MKKLGRGTILFMAVFFAMGCTEKQSGYQDELRHEIISIEKEFNDYAAEHGVKEAFVKFAADSAVLNRSGRTIKGKAAIRSYFENQPYNKVTLSWKPDFVNVSNDGSMAYTYGPFTFSAMDSLDKPVKAEGIFHTVWERQDDGSWKYVYD